MASSAQQGSSAVRSAATLSLIPICSAAGQRHRYWPKAGSGIETVDGAISNLPLRRHSLGRAGALQGHIEWPQLLQHVQHSADWSFLTWPASISCAHWQGQGKSSRMENNQCISPPTKDFASFVVSEDTSCSVNDDHASATSLQSCHMRGYRPARSIRRPLAMTTNSLNS